MKIKRFKITLPKLTKKSELWKINRLKYVLTSMPNEKCQILLEIPAES